MKNIYLDTETTDFNPGQIAELSMIVEDETNKFIGAYNYYFKVDSMEQGAQEVHGLSMDRLVELSDGKTFKDHYTEIHNILNGNRLVAHNEAFDEKFISAELWRCGVSFTPADRVCTMNFFKNIMQLPAKYTRYGKYKNPKLLELVDYLHISVNEIDILSQQLFKHNNETSFHDSRFDTTALYVAVNIYREILHGKGEWHNRFVK